MPGRRQLRPLSSPTSPPSACRSAPAGPGALQRLHLDHDASNLASSVGKTRSGQCSRMIGRLVGTQTTQQLVDPAHLPAVLRGRAGHAGQLLVQPEVALEGDLGGVVGGSVIGTPSLASTAWCSPSRQWRSGIGRPVNSSMMTTLSFVDHVVLIAAEAVVGLQGLLDVLVQLVHRVRVLRRRAGSTSGPAACRPRSARAFASCRRSVKCSFELNLLGELVGPVIDDLFLRRGRRGSGG